MSEMKNFSPEQEREAQEWFEANAPLVWEIIVFDEHGGEVGKNELLNAFFTLKMISIELRPTQFILGVDYSGIDVAKYKQDKNNPNTIKNLKVNLSFWNPHPKGVADEFAKDFLVAKLSQL